MTSPVSGQQTSRMPSLRASALLSASLVLLALFTGCGSREAEAEDAAWTQDAFVAEDAEPAPDAPMTPDASSLPNALEAGERDAGGDAATAPVSDAMPSDAALDATLDATPDSGPVTDAGPSLPLVADIAYDAFTKVFYTVQNGKGYYVNNSGTANADAWWTQAELIEMAIDAYERKPSAAYRSLMTELVAGFVAKQGTDWTYNDFNDDIAWMVIASARAHLHTQNADFLRYAKQNWDAMYARAASTDYGGGLWWKVKVDSKNACINGPGAIGAYLLYKATGEAGYLAKAKAIYAWERATLFDLKTGAVYDNINPQGGDKWTFTYNSGTFIGIANYLYRETSDKAYYNDAKLAADFAKNKLSDADGLIKENDVSGDGAAFKPIMFRWLMKFVTDNGLAAEYVPWLQRNANRAWANRRAGDQISWNNWKEATPHRILDSHGAMATVQILQVVPPGGAEVAWYNSAPQVGTGQIEAERCDEKRGMTIEASEAGGEQLGGIGNDAWARYGQLDFGQTAPSTFEARVSVAGGAGGSIEIHADRLNGALLGTLTTTPTGSWTSYSQQSAPIAKTTGVHDVYLVFKPSMAGGFVANLNWFRLR
jgi:predicted alpha-1,6-mannanase (GH76 family)